MPSSVLGKNRAQHGLGVVPRVEGQCWAAGTANAHKGQDRAKRFEDIARRGLSAKEGPGLDGTVRFELGGDRGHIEPADAVVVAQAHQVEEQLLFCDLIDGVVERSVGAYEARRPEHAAARAGRCHGHPSQEDWTRPCHAFSA